MTQRRLPPHEELYRLVAEQGRTYREIGAAYDVAPEHVCRTFRRGQEQRGGEWPVKRPAPVLPTWAEIVHLITACDLSYRQIAEKFKVPYTTMEGHLRRTAKANGYDWPLIGWTNGHGTGPLGEVRRLRGWRQHYKQTTVDPAITRDVLYDFLHHRPDYTLVRIAHESGLTLNFVHNISTPNRRNQRADKRLCLKLVRFLDKVQYGPERKTNVIRYYLWCRECDIHATALSGDSVMQAVEGFLATHHRHDGVWVCPPGAQPGQDSVANVYGALDSRW